jgi:hypothetical protein
MVLYVPITAYARYCPYATPRHDGTCAVVWCGLCPIPIIVKNKCGVLIASVRNSSVSSLGRSSNFDEIRKIVTLIKTHYLGDPDNERRHLIEVLNEMPLAFSPLQVLVLLTKIDVIMNKRHTLHGRSEDTSGISSST